jgi:phytoene dehydrogenase-like protein
MSKSVETHGLVYDAIALGPGLGTTLAAALLARRGKRVLLAPGRARAGSGGEANAASSSRARRSCGRQSERLPPRTRRAPDLEPWPEVFSGLQRPAVRRVLRELDLEKFVDQRLIAHEPAFQVILPKARVDVDPEDTALLEVLERELRLPRARGERLLFQLARASRAVEHLLEPSSGWPCGQLSTEEVERLQTAGEGTWFGQAAGDPALWDVIQAPSTVTSPVWTTGLGPLVMARLWSNWRHGTHSFLGGAESFELALHEQILAADGEIIADADPSSLVVSDGEGVRGVSLEGCPGTLLARGFVLGVGVDRLFSRQMLGEVVGSWLPRPQVVARRHVLHLIFRRGWLPASMARHLVVIPEPGKTLWGLVSEPSTEGEVTLTVEGVIPENSEPDALPRAEEEAVAALRAAVPFFDHGLVEVFSPHRSPGEAVPMRPVHAVALSSRQSPLLAGAPALPLDPGLGSTALIPPLALGALGTEGEFAAADAAAALAGD